MLPGVETLITDRRSARFVPASIANWFVVGYAQRGPIDGPVAITSMTQKELVLGPRTPETAILHDSLEAFIRTGGGAAYVSRVVGDGVAAATIDADNATDDPTMTIRALTAGEWGNDIDVVIDLTGSTFTLSVEYSGEEVELSPALSSVAEAVAWAEQSSDYIRIVDLDDGLPKDQTVSLAGGDADLSSVDGDNIQAALDRFPLSLGAGQVSAPGMTTTATQELVMAHAEANRRVALLDAPDTDDVSALSTYATTLRAKAGRRFSAPFWPWAVIPGLTIGTTRDVPYSAIQAGLTARANALGKTAGDPVAGVLGSTDYPLGLTQDPLTDADRETVNDLGLNVAITYLNEVRTYGNRTLANPITEKNWAQLSQSRVVASIAAIAEEVGQDFFERKLDGRGFTIADFGKEIEGRACMPAFLAGDLYGDTAPEAFIVNVGADVNTPSDVADGKLRAAIELQTSPGADKVTIEIVKVPTGEGL